MLPSGLTPERFEKVRELATKGIPRQYIAAKIQVHRDTFYEWIARGRAILAGEAQPTREAGGVHPDYAAFVLMLEEADADYVVTALSAMAGEAKGHAGHAWILERTKRDEFGASQKVEVQHSGAVALVDWSAAPLTELGDVRRAERAAIDVVASVVETLAIETTKPGG